MTLTLLCWKLISSSEVALLLLTTKNRDLWGGPTSEFRDSRTARCSAHPQSQVWQIWIAESAKQILCQCARSKNRTRPKDASMVLTNRSAASGDENGWQKKLTAWQNGCGPPTLCWRLNVRLHSRTILYTPSSRFPEFTTIRFSPIHHNLFSK